VKERPILFSAPMVRAILAGHKTQTRRIVKPQPVNPRQTCDEHIWADTIPPVTRYFSCKIGLPGDQLWVRETFSPNEVLPMKDRAPGDWIYRADLNEQGVTKYSAQWKQSIFMPRAASRIALDVTGVRVERLNDISDGDAMAEGVHPEVDAHIASRVANSPEWTPHRMEYWALWESINGPGSWDVNPWVWVIEFRMIKP
jgi:hypothetical protein